MVQILSTWRSVYNLHRCPIWSLSWSSWHLSTTWKKVRSGHGHLTCEMINQNARYHVHMYVVLTLHTIKTKWWMCCRADNFTGQIGLIHQAADRGHTQTTQTGFWRFSTPSALPLIVDKRRHLANTPCLRWQSLGKYLLNVEIWNIRVALLGY